jgi:class 3 adenylate cyclase
MPLCPACGQDNPEIARFCLACGAALSSAPPPRREERRIVTVVFVDLVGFTAQSEQLDPEDVQAFLSPYHQAVREELESFGGVVEKFIGDAVVGIFGAPTAFGDDPERAVRAAMSVRDRIEGVRIAVNTGEALVNLGARPERGEATVTGDPVNTASRLQAAAPVNEVLVGAETWRATRDAIEYRPSTPVTAKGKSEPVQAWIAVRAVTPSGERNLSSTFVGRTRELALLAETWERATTERTPHLVTVLGDAGVGKTRLAMEFARTAGSTGGLTVRGRSLPYRDSSAYGAFAAHVKQLCRIFESDPRDVALTKLRERVGTLLEPGLAEEVTGHLAILIGLDTSASVDDRETLFFSVRCFIEAVARDQPLMLIFEDLHWADGSLLDLVELLGARLRELPVLVLVLARPELLDARPSWGGGLPAYSALPLGPLSTAEALELAAERLAAHVESERVDRALELAQTAAGNPLFIEQLAATLSERSTTTADALPTTVRGLVAARLDALPAAERDVVLDAAVGGKVFWRGALERIGTGGDALGELLVALERRDLIRRETVSAIEGEPQYTFTHVLIRDVAYDLLPRTRRRERHEQVARFLEESTAEVGETGAAIARHWRDAGDDARALDYFYAAGEQAEKGWAKERAVTFYREALGLVAADDVERRRLLRRKLAVAQQQYLHVDDAQALGLGDAEARPGGSLPA